MVSEEVEYFRPTSGRPTGVAGILLAAGVAALALDGGVTGPDAPVLSGAAFLAALLWTTTLRPRVGLSRDHLVLRNPVSEARIPLAAIEQLHLRQVLAVRAGDRRFVSPAVGRTRRSLRSTAAADPGGSYPDLVEDRIQRGMVDARTRAGVALRSDEQAALAEGVRRRWAWPEIVALIVAAAGFAVATLR